MSWNVASPIVKIVPRARAYISVPKDGRARLNLTLSETLLKELGNPKRCSIDVGSGEHAGLLRLCADKSGAFAVTAFGRGGARVHMMAGEGVPDGARDGEACSVERDGITAIISLPLAAWAKQVVGTAPRSAEGKPASVAASVPKASVEPAKKINVVEYLTAKGVKIGRRGNGFMVDGEAASPSAVLVLVNRYRRAAELPDARAEDIA